MSLTTATALTVTRGVLLLKSRDGSLKEWVYFDGVSGTTVTITYRDLDLTAATLTSSSSGLDWVAGTQVILVASHYQLTDKLEGFPPASYTTAQLSSRTGKSLGEIFFDSTQGSLVYWN